MHLHPSPIVLLIQSKPWADEPVLDHIRGWDKRNHLVIGNLREYGIPVIGEDQFSDVIGYLFQDCSPICDPEDGGSPFEDLVLDFWICEYRPVEVMMEEGILGEPSRDVPPQVRARLRDRAVSMEYEIP